MMASTSQKIKSLSQLSRIVKNLKKAGKKIVLCHGVFDLIHPGHIRHFTDAKRHGDILIVTVVADRHVLKGPGRPIFPQELRCEVLSALTLIDYLSVVDSGSATSVIQKLRPDVYVRGSDEKQSRQEEEVAGWVGARTVTTGDIAFSSSQLINAHFDIYPPKTKAFLEMVKKTHTAADIVKKLEGFRRKKILVLGDTIIDQYHYSRPLGKSYKEPIVVHGFLRAESYAGGALATANHIAALSDRVSLVSILGKRRSFESFIRKKLRGTITPKFFYRSDSGTIVKRRYIDEFTGYKLFQISYVNDEPIAYQLEAHIYEYLAELLPKYEIVVVNDFGHGFLTKKLIHLITRKAKYLALNVQANSVNFGFNIVTKYPRADYVCIDNQEIRLATHDKYGDLDHLTKKIFKKLSASDIIVTKGPNGSLSYSKKHGMVEIPALTGRIVDRVGAGDALFSITVPCVWAHMDPTTVGFIGNVAASLKIATVGNKFPIDFVELTNYITRLLK